MILFPGRHLMGVLECHQLTPPNRMVELKTHELWCTITGKNTTRKKRYSRLAVGWNKSQITVCRVKIRTSTTTGKNYDQKKSTVICNTRNILFLLCLYLLWGNLANCVQPPSSCHHRRYLHCKISLIMKKNSVIW
jgi:hypothetical protein